MYKIALTKGYSRRYNKRIKNDEKLKRQTKKTLGRLKRKPFQPALKTHKVDTKRFGEKYSSSVTQDIRIIWDFTKDKEIRILLLDFGGHEGKHKVYK
jgi:mRNA-degrading endonuclease YafQ of YafQ-DinJ toxin-antitoxin module